MTVSTDSWLWSSFKNRGPVSEWASLALSWMVFQVETGRKNKRRMVICSILPADHYNWRKDTKPAEPIRQINMWLKKFAVERHLVYVDY